MSDNVYKRKMYCPNCKVNTYITAKDYGIFGGGKTIHYTCNVCKYDWLVDINKNKD